MTIRPYRPADLDALYAINQASTPGVGHEDSAQGLARWLSLGTCLVAVDESDAALGFINLIETGVQAYESANLRWFEDYVARTGRDLIYVDRIAIAAAARDQGLGEQLYRAAFEHFSNRDEIGCEVNTAPPNPGSHRFHQRLGFEEVGTRTYQDGAKAVAFYARPL
ncbi:MAG: GNAT family N-acetyltransferase [Pseudomonadota bacterium]